MIHAQPQVALLITVNMISEGQITLFQEISTKFFVWQWMFSALLYANGIAILNTVHVVMHGMACFGTLVTNK